MAELSVCMIVKNEEKVLGRCLECVKKFADEIVIVDTGSSDDTMAIARQYTDKVYEFEWINNFAAARNYSFSKATRDYAMWLDADDVIDEVNCCKIAALMQTLEADVAMFKYECGDDGAGNPLLIYYRERIVKRSNGFLWQEPVHEHLSAGGNIIEVDIRVRHKSEAKPGSTRNLDIYRAELEKGNRLSSRGLYYYSRELETHGMLQEAVDSYAEFLARGDGWVEDCISACHGRSGCLSRLGQRQDAIKAVCESFAYGAPRAKSCCLIAGLYMEAADYPSATYWYHAALRAPEQTGWGFTEPKYQAFVPHMQLCVISDKLGNREQALQHHDIALQLAPADKSALHNERYFFPNGRSV